MINKVVLLGRLANVPRSNQQNKNAVLCATFPLAIERGYKPKDENAQTVDFLHCKAFNKTAENIMNYCSKGSTVCITGQIHSNKFVKNGETQYFTEIIVENIKFLPNFGVIKTGDVLAKTPDEIWSELSEAEKAHAILTSKEEKLKAYVKNNKPQEQTSHATHDAETNTTTNDKFIKKLDEHFKEPTTSNQPNDTESISEDVNKSETQLVQS